MRILWLHETAARDRSLVGGKAAALSALTGRYPVPAGFCLPAMAAPEVSADVALSPDVMEALATGYTQLALLNGRPAPAVAVRSSSIGEDGAGVSFAGQHTSFLHVTGVKAVAEAVRLCLRSARSERAMAYRAQHGLTGEPQMAVLVQQFVPADVAGVAFSVSPRTGDPGEVLIHAAWGLGESLVGGRVTPDLYRLSRRDLALLESQVARKQRMTVAVPGGTEEVEVPRFLAEEPALTAAQAQEVARLAIALEAERGHPVDLEFAFADGRLHLLQCRPVTGVALAGAGAPASSAMSVMEAQVLPPPEFPVVWENPEDAGQYWSHYAAMYPDQVLPMYASFFTPWTVAWMQENPGTLCEWRRINTYLYNRFYPNPEAPPSSEPPFLTANQLQSLWQESILPELQGHILQLASLDLSAVPRLALRSQLDEVVDRFIQIWELHWRVVNPVETALRRYRELFGQLFPGAAPLEELRLLQGFENKSLESNRVLWHLSCKVGEEEALLTLFRQHGAAGVLGRLRTRGEPWLLELTAYLERYGRRFDLWDWTRPSWLEEPVRALAAVQSYLANPAFDPEAEAVRLATERQGLAEEARRRLAGYPRPVRERFEASLRAAQVATMLNEEHNFWIDHRCMYEIRRALLSLGRRLAGNGLIDAPEEIWYLRLEEARELASGAPVFSLRALLAQRRQEMARWAGVRPPSRLGTRPPHRLRPGASGASGASGALGAEEVGLLKGTAWSPGTARGRARLLRSLAEAGRLQPGEILVTSALSPAWTPLFAVAAAVVTDGGGALSHGAILARECRLPAVAVAEATRRIADGQWLEVDGSGGTVRVGQ